MSTKIQNYIAVFAIIIKDNHILLQQRLGHINHLQFDMAASGHLEPNETIKDAIIRELKEEINLIVKPTDIDFVLLNHCHYKEANTTYHNSYFVVHHYSGVPKIMEPEKIATLQWFPLDQLPDNLSPDRKLALDAYLRGESFVTFGFDGDCH